MKYGESPQVPGMWTKCLLSKFSFLPEASETQRVQDIFARLKRDGFPHSGFLPDSESVAVIASFHAGLFGGPVSQILKCLTAIKICNTLKLLGISAVPVCWIRSAPPDDSSQCSMFLLDHRSELEKLELMRSRPEDFSARDSLPWDQIAPLLGKIEEMGRDTFDGEILDVLRDAYCSDATFSSAAAHLVRSWMQEWGMLVVEAENAGMEHALLDRWSKDSHRDETVQPRTLPHIEEPKERGSAKPPSGTHLPWCVIPSMAMPVLVSVVDPRELLEYEQASPVFADLGLTQPAIWPQCSATVLDGRSRSTLRRFNLNLLQLFSGEDAVMEIIKENNRYSAPETLLGLQEQVHRCMSELRALSFPGNELVEMSNACREKVTFQLGKLRMLCNRAIEIKEGAARRRVHRATNFLAPDGRSQETALGGIQIPLRFSRAGLRSIYENLDIYKFEHQLIEMD